MQGHKSMMMTTMTMMVKTTSSSSSKSISQTNWVGYMNPSSHSVQFKAISFVNQQIFKSFLINSNQVSLFLLFLQWMFGYCHSSLLLLHVLVSTKAAKHFKRFILIYFELVLPSDYFQYLHFLFYLFLFYLIHLSIIILATLIVLTYFIIPQHLEP